MSCEYLVVATGHHSKPKVPEFPGQANFAGETSLLDAYGFLSLFTGASLANDMVVM